MPEQTAGASAASANVVDVTAMPLVEEHSYQRRSYYTGMIEPVRQSQPGFEVGGRLQRMHVDEGDDVLEGQLLAELNTERLEARLAEVKAGLTQAKTQASLAASTLQRLQEARDFDGVSAQQLDEAQMSAASTQAAVEAARSRVNTVALDIAKSKLYAPYNASVLRRMYDEGQVLAPGAAVLDLHENVAPEIRLGIGGAQIDLMVPGEQHFVVVRDHTIPVVVKAVMPVRDPVARTVDVIFGLADSAKSHAPNSRVRPGDLARLEIDTTVAATGFRVPITALTEGARGLWNVLLLAPDASLASGASHVVRTRAVELHYQDGTEAYIHGPLQQDDLIVAAGVNRVVPGQHVRIGTMLARTQ